MITYQHPSLHFSKNEVFSLVRHSGKTGLHWHSALEFLYFKKGKLELSLNGRKCVVGEGDFVIINSSVVHSSSKLLEPLDYYILIVNDEFLRTNRLYSDGTEFGSVIDAAEVSGIFERIIEEYEHPDDYSNSQMLSYIISLFVFLNRRARIEADTSDAGDAKKITMVRRTLSFLQEKYKERLTVEEIADSLHFSRSYLSHSFKEITGHSLMNYVNLLRCQNAKTMILNGAELSEAAIDSGFNELSYFTRVFKKTMGTLPSLVKGRVFTLSKGEESGSVNIK